MWRATLKGLLAHKFRLALTALSIVLGVGFVAGTFVLTDTINHTFDDLFTEVTSGVDVYVRAEAGFVGQTASGRDRIPEGLLEVVRDVEGVDHAQGSIGGYAQFVGKDGEAIAPFGPPTLGFNWGEYADLNPLRLRDGRTPEGPGEVVMDAGTADKHGFRVGDRVRILFQQGADDFTVVGIATFGASNNLAGATLAAFETSVAQNLFGAPGRFDSIEVAASGDVAPADLRLRIGSVLPPKVEAVTGTRVADEQSDVVKEGLSFFNTFLLVFAGIALFVGAFIIFNTFNILVSQRTRELALLRAIGASGRQVMASVLAEALVVGLVASLAGLGLGVLVAVGLQAMLSALGIELPSSDLQVLPRTVVVSLVVGMVVTLASAVFPARRAARVAPIAALRETAVDHLAGIGRRAAVGTVVAALGLAALLVGLFADVQNGLSLVGLGVALIFVGVVGIAPLFARPLVRVLGAPARALRGVPGKLGQANAMRSPKRTASTAGALMIGLALVSAFAVLGSSLKESTGKVLADLYRADFILNANRGFTLFSPDIARHLRSLDEVDVAAEMRFGEFRRPGRTSSSFLKAFDPDTLLEVAAVEFSEGGLDDLDVDEVLLARDVAEDAGVSVGDPFPVVFARTGKVPLRVAGIYEKNQILDQYVISLAAFGDNFTEQLDQSVFVNGAPGYSAAEVRRAIEGTVEPFPNVEVQDQAEFRRSIEEQTDQLLNMIYGLLFLAILIALLGIVNTLALSVHERTRELGLLRAVGLGRGQTRSMIRWESVIIAVLGGVLGVILGLFFAWALVTALADEGVTELAVPVGNLLVYVVIAGLAGVIAAALPARRAARLDILQAIAYE